MGRKQTFALCAFSSVADTHLEFRIAVVVIPAIQKDTRHSLASVIASDAAVA